MRKLDRCGHRHRALHQRARPHIARAAIGQVHEHPVATGQRVLVGQPHPYAGATIVTDLGVVVAVRGVPTSGEKVAAATAQLLRLP
ncbi:hypothetical protein G6F24_017167 [Rhizopus arrhizus]|nr:hypothetical protein G6F24_017167 [Rhizopus arrhizus]